MADDQRLGLDPHPPASAHLDGAWWPRSTQLGVELPGLVASLADRLGQVVLVGYRLNAWTDSPPQIQIAGSTVNLQGFTSDEPATIILVDRDGHRVALRVIPPDAPEQVAQHQLAEASKPAGDEVPANTEAERSAVKSLAEVASQLDRHEGRHDAQRTADIARWCDEAAQQFVDAPIQAFAPILVHHIVRTKMASQPDG